MQATQFINTVAPQAVKARLEGSPMFASLRIAQNMWETGCVIHEWFNLGGIKVGGGKPNGFWKGATVNKNTWEVYNGVRVDIASNFRAYDSILNFYKDQDILFSYPRYKRVRESTTPRQQASMLFACGYATDPNYSAGLIGMINRFDLDRFDKEVDDTMDELLKRIQALEALTQSLHETPPPAWFTKEFGTNALKNIVNDTTGDVDFWRLVAVALRVSNKK